MGALREGSEEGIRGRFLVGLEEKTEVVDVEVVDAFGAAHDLGDGVCLFFVEDVANFHDFEI